MVEETVESKMGMEEKPPKVMSVELAIRREFAYRAMVEDLKLQAQEECTVAKPSISVASQGPSSTRPPAPPHSRRPQLVHPGSLACIACQVDLSSLSDLIHHSGSKSHKLKIMELKQQGREPNNPFWCSLCQAPSSSVYQLETHLIGARHATSLKTIKKSTRS